MAKGVTINSNDYKFAVPATSSVAGVGLVINSKEFVPNDLNTMATRRVYDKNTAVNNPSKVDINESGGFIS